MDAALVKLLAVTAAGARGEWDADHINGLAAAVPLSTAMSRQERALYADTALLWSRWLLESIVCTEDLARFDQYIRLARRVDAWLRSRLPQVDPGDRPQILRTLTTLLWQERTRRQDIRRRDFTKDERAAVWAAAGSLVRCFLCGFAFPEEERGIFVDRRRRAPTRDVDWVDVLKPQGMEPRDRNATIEHLGALSRGGDNSLDNLRITCGWCNNAKKDGGVTFDVLGHMTRYRHSRLGTILLPPRFWVVRALAVQRRCWKPGCRADASNAQMTVNVVHRTGAPTPLNITVTCYEHDNLTPNRFVPRDSLRQ